MSRPALASADSRMQNISRRRLPGAKEPAESPKKGRFRPVIQIRINKPTAIAAQFNLKQAVNRRLSRCTQKKPKAWGTPVLT